MATKEELFISVSPQIYRRDKSAVLTAQTDLLQTLKHFQNLKVLSRQKNDLKIRLYKLMSSVVNQINSLQEKLPTPKVPKTIHRYESPTIESKTTFSKRDDIEDELKLIQTKLQELNS